MPETFRDEQIEQFHAKFGDGAGLRPELNEVFLEEHGRIPRRGCGEGA